MQEPWKTDEWYTSLWNHLPEARKNTKFQKNLKIHDVTLRDGEQQTAVVFRREEKVAIARKLDAMGIHRIEAGMPAVSEQDKAAISDIAALGLNAEIFAFSRCIPDEIKVVKNTGVKGVVVEIPASDHMIKNAYGWSVDRAMKSSIDTTLAAKEAGLYTVFFTIDATRTIANFWPYATTVFDYIRRAMPWQSPRTLTDDEVYALTAYILALNKLIGENDVMNAESLPKVKMPNRDGFTPRFPNLMPPRPGRDL